MHPLAPFLHPGPKSLLDLCARKNKTCYNIVADYSCLSLAFEICSIVSMRQLQKMRLLFMLGKTNSLAQCIRAFSGARRYLVPRSFLIMALGAIHCYPDFPDSEALHPFSVNNRSEHSLRVVVDCWQFPAVSVPFMT
jgi:hypothetical protein